MSTLHEVLELTFKPRRPAWDVPGVAGEQPWWSRYAEVLLADVRRLEPNGNMEGVYHEKVRWTNNLHPLGMLKWLNPATWDVLTWLFLKCFLVSIHLLKCRILVPEKCGTVAHCYIYYCISFASHGRIALNAEGMMTSECSEDTRLQAALCCGLMRQSF